MAAVTQRIPSFLAGVSQQTDDLKFPGQLRTCINGYPEPTFGMIKRPGGKFLAELKNTSNALITPGALDDAKWFSIFRDSTEQYLCAIKSGAISVWSLVDGSAKTVNYGSGAAAYLTGGKDDYDILTINDYTFITNKAKVVTTTAPTSYTYGIRATVRLLSVEYGAKYDVVVNGTTCTYTTFNAEATITSPSQTRTTVNEDAILNSLRTSIDAIANIDAVRVGSTIEITSTNNTAFTITAKGGQDGEALVFFQDTVENFSKLPSQSTHGRIVQVANSVNQEDDYYLKFFADNGTSGVGYWEETIKPGISTGFTVSTMPHQLVRNSNGTFTFQQTAWELRLVGDDESNPHPSFVNSTIQQLFFYNNRLGVLSEESVVTSQSGDFFNFYSNTALTSIASDPVDIACSSIRPAVLHGVVPVAQGLLLFSRSQQFLLTGEGGVITPANSAIKTIANYEMDTLNDPVDMGTTVAFISKTPSYSRVFEMQTRGQDESPIVIDISRIVQEYVPSTVDQVVSSPQNSLLALGTTGSRDLYLFRYYTSGDQREIQSWFQWKVSGALQHLAIDRDVVWVITKQDASYVIQKLPLVQSPSTSVFLTSDGSKVDPRLDIWSAPSSVVFNSTPGDQYTKVYLPFKHEPNRTICVVTSNPNLTTPNYANAGLVLFPAVFTDGGGQYAKILDSDLSGDTLIVGYTYDMDYEMPRIYYRSGSDQQASDYTASLIVARMKFMFGLTGDVTFKLQARGRSEWVDTQGVRDADYYLANDIPFVSTTQFTLPIHQRSENFRVRVFSSSPFPVSLVSMSWEGNYSPRFYARR